MDADLDDFLKREQDVLGSDADALFGSTAGSASLSQSQSPGHMVR